MIVDEHPVNYSFLSVSCLVQLAKFKRSTDKFVKIRSRSFVFRLCHPVCIRVIYIPESQFPSVVWSKWQPTGEPRDCREVPTGTGTGTTGRKRSENEFEITWRTADATVLSVFIRRVLCRTPSHRTTRSATKSTTTSYRWKCRKAGENSSPRASSGKRTDSVSTLTAQIPRVSCFLSSFS